MFYGFARFICRFFLLTVRRLEIRGAGNIPRQGGFLLVSNHRSYWDPIIIGCALPKSRRIYFMAKQELFKIPVLGWLINMLGAFPVKRGGADRTAIRTALDHLSAGRVVGIFPEGTRSKNEDMLDPHRGAAMLSTKAFVPVLPVAVIGFKGFLSKASIVFGPPIYLVKTGSKDRRVSREDLETMSRTIMNEVAVLMAAKSGDIG